MRKLEVKIQYSIKPEGLLGVGKAEAETFFTAM